MTPLLCVNGKKALFSDEELGIKLSNFKQRNVILGWDFK